MDWEKMYIKIEEKEEKEDQNNKSIKRHVPGNVLLKNKKLLPLLKGVSYF